jgi:hypothetical protein
VPSWTLRLQFLFLLQTPFLDSLNSPLHAATIGVRVAASHSAAAHRNPRRMRQEQTAAKDGQTRSDYRLDPKLK